MSRLIKKGSVKKNKKSKSLKISDYYDDSYVETRHNENISEKNFFIPDIEQYSLLLNYNYKIKQLQKICKHYKQKTTGKKCDILNNIYNYLKLSACAVNLQKIMRGFLLRAHNRYRGPAYYNRSLCNNDTDFFTLDNMKEVNNYQFISYINENGIIYGYDIVSLYNLIVKNGKNTTNPYDRTKFPSYLLSNIQKLKSLSKALNYDMKINIEQENTEDKKKNIEFKVISIFQKIDEHGFITNIDWFNKLSANCLVRYIRELGDIWNYRAQLSNETKINICPPHGNPFIYFNTNYYHTSNNIEQLKLSVLKVMDALVNNGISNENRSLGAFYVLSALTLVNNDAAESLPWLYQSVVHN